MNNKVVMDTQVNQKEKDLLILELIVFGILYTNDTVCDEISIAYHKTKATKTIFRHKTKQLATMLMKESSKYKEYIRRTLKNNNQFLASGNNIFDADVYCHVEDLLSICQDILKQHNVAYKDVVARWWIVYILSQIAASKIISSKTLIKKMRIQTKFDNLGLSKICKLARRMCQEIYKGPDIDFTAYENYNATLKTLIAKTCSPDVINRAMCGDSETEEENEEI